VQNLTGVSPIVYTSTYYAGYVNPSLNTYGLWIAKPNTSPTDPPTSLGNWNNWLFKQYSWTGSVSGISGNVDLNVFHGSIDDFNELIGQGPLANDECANPILLTSSTSCMPTSGTVNDATKNWPKASCDLYPGNSNLKDVFYQFTAVSTNQTITVHPTEDLDAVLSLYEGSDCNNLTEIGCSDNGGGYGQPEILNVSNLNIGQTYWIRIYDYGSQPPSNGDFEICVTHTGATSEDIFLSNALITSSPTIMAGDDVAVEVNQNYSGNASTVPDVYLYYYLSTDCDLDGADILLYDQDYSTINSTDLSDEESQVLTIPAGTTPGTYYILMVGDATDTIAESDESNNTACAKITIIDTTGEDISLSNEMITSSATVNPGETVTVEVTQNYTGNNTSLPDVYLYTYLSTDCHFDNSDVLLNDQNFSTINSTQTSEVESQTLTIPNGTNAGTYYLLFVADATNVVSENNENNNTACLQIIVTSSSPEDIFLSNINISTHVVQPGDTVTIEANQNYIGQSNDVPNVYLYYYLSTNCKLNSSDVLLNNQDYSTINVNDPTDEESRTLTIPNSTNLGKYYLLVVADATNVINESDEDNNMACIQIIVANIVDNQDITIQDKIKIYPNPVQSYLHFDTEPGIKIDHIEIINGLGQTILTEQNATNELNLDGLSQGIYFVKFITTDQDMAIFRIVKMEKL